VHALKAERDAKMADMAARETKLAADQHSLVRTCEHSFV
jgi:hypothetical protein